MIWERLAPVGLAELSTTASLLTRMDRKYTLPRSAVPDLAAHLPAGTRVLDIDGHHTFNYRSVYFDTPARDSYLLAARGRPHRFKVRIRQYCDSGESHLEVKIRHGGATVKHRQPHPVGLLTLDRRHLDFIAACLAEGGVAEVRPECLKPVLTTTYTRTTLLGPEGNVRLTLDQDLTWSSHGHTLRLPELAIAETKSHRHTTSLDGVLWRSGHRPRRLSKFATGMAALHPELPSNRWHNTLHNHF